MKPAEAGRGWRLLRAAVVRAAVVGGAAAWSFGAPAALMAGAAAAPAAALEVAAEGASRLRRSLAVALAGAAACLAVPAAFFQSVYAWVALRGGAPGEAARVTGEGLTYLPADPVGAPPPFDAWLAALPWFVDASAWQERSWCLAATATLTGTVLALGAACRLFVRTDRDDLRARLALRGLQVLTTTVGAAALGLVWFILSPEPPPAAQLRSLEGIEEASQLWGLGVVLGAAWPVAGTLDDLSEDRLRRPAT